MPDSANLYEHPKLYGLPNAMEDYFRSSVFRMITAGGSVYNTIVDAAKAFGGVSTKTVKGWIEKKIIEEPPEFEYGVRTIQHFPAEYIAKAKEQLKRYRNNKHKRKAKGK